MNSRGLPHPRLGRLAHSPCWQLPGRPAREGSPVSVFPLPVPQGEASETPQDDFNRKIWRQKKVQLPFGPEACATYLPKLNPLYLSIRQPIDLKTQGHQSCHSSPTARLSWHHKPYHYWAFYCRFVCPLTLCLSWRM